jgi:hypothetical protein
MTYTINDARVEHETADAILVEADEFDEPVWIPKSCIDDDSEVYEDGTEGTLIVKKWFAKKNGWI